MSCKRLHIIYHGIVREVHKAPDMAATPEHKKSLRTNLWRQNMDIKQSKLKFGAEKLCTRSNWKSHANNSYSIASHKFQHLGIRCQTPSNIADKPFSIQTQRIHA